LGIGVTLLLDTCAFIWLTSAPEFLGAKAAKALGEPSNDRALSLASIWEITLKHHSGKLPLPSPPEVWIEEQLRLQDIEVLPMQRVVIYRSGSLPPIHKDPFDRVIAAEALHRDLRLLSPDEPFAKYGCSVIW
jgi:PIN domain nuclease of toxin-antitoxin system